MHTVWAPIPGFVKDYIATPKPNGYQVPPQYLSAQQQCRRIRERLSCLAASRVTVTNLWSELLTHVQSLHTTVLPLGSEPLFPLEVHIRTGAMHRLAQCGIACENWVAAFRSNR